MQSLRMNFSKRLCQSLEWSFFAESSRGNEPKRQLAYESALSAGDRPANDPLEDNISIFKQLINSIFLKICGIKLHRHKNMFL